MKENIIDFKHIGQRLRAYRIASSLSADKIADSIGISRAAVYRLEKGEIIKIETLEKLASLLGTTLPCLLGVDTEYYSNAAGFFERMRQLEESATHIYSHFSPFSYLLTSGDYDAYLRLMLTESSTNHPPLNQQDMNTLSILAQRKQCLLNHKPKVFNLISIQQIEKFLHLGLIGTLNLSPSSRMKRILQAHKEVKHLIDIMDSETTTFEIAISQETIPSHTFQIFYQHTLPLSVAVSPFRLGELPNISGGIASVTNSREAIRNYYTFFNKIWERALKKNDALKLLKDTLDRY